MVVVGNRSGSMTMLVVGDGNVVVVEDGVGSSSSIQLITL